jgi:hypothetical protein
MAGLLKASAAEAVPRDSTGSNSSASHGAVLFSAACLLGHSLAMCSVLPASRGVAA